MIDILGVTNKVRQGGGKDLLLNGLEIGDIEVDETNNNLHLKLKANEPHL